MILLFTAPGCSACKHVLRNVDARRSSRVVAVAGGDADAVAATTAAHDVNVVLVDAERKVMRLYGVIAVPTAFLVAVTASLPGRRLSGRPRSGNSCGQHRRSTSREQPRETPPAWSAGRGRTGDPPPDDATQPCARAGGTAARRCAAARTFAAGKATSAPRLVSSQGSSTRSSRCAASTACCGNESTRSTPIGTSRSGTVLEAIDLLNASLTLLVQSAGARSYTRCAALVGDAETSCMPMQPTGSGRP